MHVHTKSEKWKNDKLSQGFPSCYILWWSKSLETTDPTPKSPQHLTQSWTNPTCVQLFKENLAWVENWTWGRKRTEEEHLGFKQDRTVLEWEFLSAYNSECTNTKLPPAYFKINIGALEQCWSPFPSRFKIQDRKVLPVASHIFPQKSGEAGNNWRRGSASRTGVEKL